MSEVSTDCEVSDKLSQMYVIRKEDLYEVFVELSNPHRPERFFGVNLWVKWSTWCMHEAIHSQDNLPASYRETAWKYLSFGAFKGILCSSESGN